MKKTVFLICAAFMAIIMLSCSSSKEKAKEYNHAIIKEQVAINGKIERLFDTFKEAVPGKMDTAYSEALMQLKAGTDSVFKMKDFDGKNELRDAALGLFSVYDTVLNKGFKEMIDLLKLPDNQYTKEKEEQCIAVRDQIMHKIDVAFTKLLNAQKNFAGENKLDLEENK